MMITIIDQPERTKSFCVIGERKVNRRIKNGDDAKSNTSFIVKFEMRVIDRHCSTAYLFEKEA